MRQRGYGDRITLGTLTGGGALGNLIPPSLFLLVYATVVQQSAIDLFVATIIPGAVAVVMFMLCVAYQAWRDPTLVPAKAPRYSWGEFFVALGQVAPMLLLICAIIASMYFGIVTPTEAAAFGCLLVLILAAFYREMTRRELWTALINSIAVSCVMSIIVINGQILGFAIVQAGIGKGLDGLAMMLLTVPVLYPTLKAMGFDDIWFGVFLVIHVELAQLSPPIGLNLLAVQSVARDIDMKTITLASLPYMIMLSALCYLLYFFPQMALWLVATMK